MVKIFNFVLSVIMRDQQAYVSNNTHRIIHHNSSSHGVRGAGRNYTQNGVGFTPVH